MNMKLSALAAITLAFAAAPAFAQSPEAPTNDAEELYKVLPELPEAAKLGSKDIASHFKLTKQDPSGNPTIDHVIYAGVSDEGNHVAFSAIDIPEYRSTYSQASTSCNDKGSNWKLPSYSELKLVSYVLPEFDNQPLPGSYWSTTLAPCDKCESGDKYKMTYDVRSGSFRNVYSLPFMKVYGMCAYQVP